jgi:hypothetical protein
MIKHVFLKQDNLKSILNGDKTLLKQPVGFCYDDGQPRTMFVGTKRDAPDEVYLTKGGDIQFNLKEARPKGEQKASEGEKVDLATPAEAQEAADDEGAQGGWDEYAQARLENDDIPF